MGCSQMPSGALGNCSPDLFYSLGGKMEAILNEILQAEHRVRGMIRETPLERCNYLSELIKGDVFLKLENRQHTGSFKVRGALSKLSWLPEPQRKAGVVAASTGNHGAAVAFGMAKTATPGLVFVPENASPAKVEAIRAYGAEVRAFGLDGLDTETHARDFARKRGMTYLSPYNDPQVIGGQGTMGVELARQLDRIDLVFAALGGGGLISGIAAYLKTLNPKTLAVACSPENSPVLIESMKIGRVLVMDSKPTLSDGTAGGLEDGSITFDLCRQLIDHTQLVSEGEIADGMRFFIEQHRMLAEGAAGVAIAAFLKNLKLCAGKRVVIVICGGNISLETLKTIL